MHDIYVTHTIYHIFFIHVSMTFRLFPTLDHTPIISPTPPKVFVSP